MLVGAGRMRIYAGPSLHIMREATARKHNPVLCLHPDRATVSADCRSGHTAVLKDQLTRGGERPYRRSQIKQCAGETRDECISIDQELAATVAGDIVAVLWGK